MAPVPTPPPSSPPGPRLSDTERDRVIEVLARACAEGRLTLDEFSGRVDTAQRAVFLTDMDPVVADLPHPFGPDLAGLLTGEAALAVPTAPVPDRRPATYWTVSVMGGSQRRGRWRLPPKTRAVAVMGGCLLDLRDAEVEGPTVVINATAIMGGIDIIVPEGIEVELGGIAVMGGKSARGINRVPPLPGAPRVRVRAFAFWGGVDVRTKPPRARLEAGRAEPELPGQPAGGDGGAGGAAGGHHPAPLPRLIDAVAEGPAGTDPELGTAADLPDGTVTIMFSDIEGFTSVTERLGDRRAMDLLREHNDIVRRRIGRSGGREVKSQGDGFMIAFGSASRALDCAVGIQHDLEARNTSDRDVPIHVRLGLHAGEAVRDGDDFMGGAVDPGGADHPAGARWRDPGVVSRQGALRPHRPVPLHRCPGRPVEGPVGDPPRLFGGSGRRRGLTRPDRRWRSGAVSRRTRPPGPSRRSRPAPRPGGGSGGRPAAPPGSSGGQPPWRSPACRPRR